VDGADAQRISAAAPLRFSLTKTLSMRQAAWSFMASNPLPARMNGCSNSEEEALRRAGAKQNDFGVERGKEPEAGERERGKIRRGPSFDHAVRQDGDAAAKAGRVDFDVAQL
jgi:hypothetical protein